MGQEAMARTHGATLHMLCGKIGAGKSTLAAELGCFPDTLVLSEDAWLVRLYPENRGVDDYVRAAGRLRRAMGEHVVQLLRTGISVVLDFPANTLANRLWMRSLFEAAAVPHILHYLDVSDEECRARLQRRNESGSALYVVTDAQFALVTSQFEAPNPDEGFDLIVHRGCQAPNADNPCH